MKFKEKTLEISASVLKKMVEKEQQRKPSCGAVLHQPKRPAALKKSVK
ncbi:cyclic lactone autoinducer peptide [Eubacterium sp. MSJ-13]|nr:cyclic lactone autoinducer peptide [Eubacterium sp. MSJ-13]MBU5478286.1 cyclic lactone autoinducer peptide [Eubacterium sp. MSJ-13]